jgi:hypothetical protein
MSGRMLWEDLLLLVASFAMLSDVRRRLVFELHGEGAFGFVDGESDSALPLSLGTEHK